jgi:hypothetical protein
MTLRNPDPAIVAVSNLRRNLEAFRCPQLKNAVPFGYLTAV